MFLIKYKNFSDYYPNYPKIPFSLQPSIRAPNRSLPLDKENIPRTRSLPLDKENIPRCKNSEPNK